MREKILTLLKFVISFGLLFYLLQRNSLSAIVHELSTAHLSWILLGLLLFTISNLLGALQWHLLLKNANVSLSYYQVLRYYYIGLFFNNIFLSNMGGDVLRLYYIGKKNQNSSAAVSTIFLDRFLGFTMLTFLAVIGGMYWVSRFGVSKIWSTVLTLMSCWLLVIMILFNRKIGHFAGFLLKWVVPEKILVKIRDIYHMIYMFSRNRPLVISVFSISLFIQFFRVMIHFIAGKAVGVEAGLLSFLIFIPLIALVASLPISIGGLGVREQSGVFLFKKVGVPGSLAVSMEFLAYILTILASIPGIVFFLLTEKEEKA